MNKYCQNCKQKFTGRLDAKFCSNQCRADFHNRKIREMKNSSFEKETVTTKAKSDSSDLELVRNSLIKKLSEKANIEMALNLTQSAKNPEIPFQVQAWLNKIHRALPIDFLVNELQLVQLEIDSLLELIEKMEKNNNLAETKK